MFYQETSAFTPLSEKDEDKNILWISRLIHI
jgi:hypothetical protein